MLKAEWLKWWQTIKISWAVHTAYRFNFITIVAGPSLVFFFIKYNLWTSIYQDRPGAVIQGYSFEKMITYHIWVLIIALIGKGYASMNLSQDIRMGKISTYLVYPFNFWEFHTAGWISHQCLQMFIALVTVTILMGIGLLPPPGIGAFTAGFLFTTLIGLFWFTLQYLLGLLAFWLEETWMLRVIALIVTSFLSGAFVPLELYPEAVTSLLEYTPFPWLTFYPVKIFMGEIPLQFHAILVILSWAALFAFCNHLIWRRGLRLYTAAGM